MDFSSLSPEDIQKLSELLSNQDQITSDEGDTDYQHQLQAGLRPPEGRQAGRTYVAANPLEHIGNFLQSYQSHKKENANDADVKALRKQINDARYRAMMGIQNSGQYGNPMSVDPLGRENI